MNTKKTIKILLGIDILVYIIFIVKVYLIQGITCNDEVQLRLFSQKGLGYFFQRTIVDENIKKGRLMAIVGNFKFLSFVSNNTYYSKIIEIIVLVIAIILCVLLILRITDNIWFSVIEGVITLAFIPITFEHAPPNAFNIVSLQPMILLLVSFILFYDYEYSKKKNKLFCSIIFYFWALCLYEFILTYIMIFPILSCIVHNRLYKKNNYIEKTITKEMFLLLGRSKWHFITSIFYFILYVLQRIIAPSSYAGNTVRLSDIKSILKVLFVLWKSSIPGYFLWNNKYKYLFTIYEDQSPIDGFHRCIDIIIILILLSSILIFCYIKGRMIINNERKSFKLLLIVVAFVYTIIPSLPNAITSLYQDNVSEEFFTSLPVSIYLYFAMVFLLTYILWQILVDKRLIAAMVLCGVLYITALVQNENIVFAEEKKNNFDRFCKIESLLKSDYWKEYNKEIINAPSIYETRNLLAIEDYHWTYYTQIYGNNVKFESSFDERNKYNIEMQDDYNFLLYSMNDCIYITQYENHGPVLCKKIDGENLVVTVDECIWRENGWYFYKVLQTTEIKDDLSK